MNASVLIAKVRGYIEEHGYITYAGLDALLPEFSGTVDELEELFGALSKQGITVYNSERDHAHHTRPKKRRGNRAGGPVVFRDPVDRYARQLEKAPKLSKDEIEALLAEIRELATAGNAVQEAELREKRNLLVSTYLRLVFSQAARYVNRGVDYIDLVQEGNQALVEAVAKVGPHVPQRFTSYISSVVRDAMLAALHKNGSIITLSLKDEQRLKKLKKDFNRLEQFVEIIDHDDVRREERIRQGEEIRQLSDVKRMRSLNAPVHDGDMSSLSDYVPDEDGLPQSDMLLMAENMSLVRELLAELSEKEQRIISIRYGLAGDGYRSLQEAADDLDLSPIAARNLEERALRRLIELTKAARAGEDSSI